MKRLSKKDRERQIRRSLWGQEDLSRAPQKRSVKRPSSGKIVNAPKCFDVSVETYRYDLIEFFCEVEHELREGGSVRVCFKHTERLHPCGTLVFASKLDAWLTCYPGKVVGNALPKDDVVTQLFKHIGILDKLSLHSSLEATHDMVKYWHYHSGDSIQASIYKPLTLSLMNDLDHPSKELFGGCLNEAVSNVLDHAYIGYEDRKMPEALRKWWMFSQHKDGRFFVAIYDHGMSVPTSLETSAQWADIVRMIHKKDSRLIETALRSPRTRTRLEHRGKGLPEMLEFSKEMNDGGLIILSRKGGLEYRARDKSFKRRKYSTKLPGTLVIWRIPSVSGQSI